MLAKGNPDVIWAFGDELEPVLWALYPRILPTEWCLHLNLETNAAILIDHACQTHTFMVYQMQNVKWDRRDTSIDGQGVAGISSFRRHEDGTFSTEKLNEFTPAETKIRFRLHEPLAHGALPRQAELFMPLLQKILSQ